MNRERTMSSDYMNWAKTSSQARFNLATSGLASCSLADLNATIGDLEINGVNPYGYEPLMRELARKSNTTPECIVTAVGASFANHLAMAALVEPGDEVLIEHPGYELILSLAHYLGCNVKRFHRRFETGFKLDPADVESNVTSRTRLIVLTNLHNPTGVLTDENTLKQIREIALRVGARILVDEVYLEMLYVEGGGRELEEGVSVPHCFALGPEFVVTTSLTKAYGLSGIRCGWILASPELASKMWLLNDLFGATPVHPGELLSVLALRQLDKISARARALLKTNRQVLLEFLDSRDDLETVRPEFGTVVFPRLRRGAVETLCSLLRDKYDTTVVPGRFFEMPNHFRIGIGCDSEMLAAGLNRLGQALDEMTKDK